MKTTKSNADELPILLFETQAEWASWLAEHHAAAPGLWLRLAKKAANLNSITYSEALEEALCYGWIDGQKKSYDDQSWLQKFTPRGPRSIWSKINREKAEQLIESKRMKPAGLAAVERARQNGRWNAAYDSATTATVPADFQAELDKNSEAAAFFATLNGTNRYAILFRIQTAQKAETRARRIQQFIEMLARGEKLYP
ncbi:MAG: bacteriocin-protection protein [Chloroflexi bacterium]|nr:MAG: bacteriocin-protection protein [Chloroflexota bacterium]